VKTISLKKVAVVAVASLGFGLLSVVPAQAAVPALTMARGTITPADGSAVVGSAVTIPVTLAVAAGGDTAGANTFTIGFAQKPVNTALVDTSIAAGVTTRNASFATAGASLTQVTAATNVLTATYGATAAAVTAAAAGEYVFTPDVPGIYSVTVTAAGAAGTPTVTTMVQVVIIVGGAQLVQASSGKGTASGTATTGGSAVVKYQFPGATAAAVRYNVTSSGVGSVLNPQDCATKDATLVSGATVVRCAAGGTTSEGNINGVNNSEGIFFTNTNASVGNVVTGSAVTTTVTFDAVSNIAGVQTLRVTEIALATGIPTTVATITITWGASPVVTAGTSIARMNAGATTTATAGSDATILVSKSLATQAANIIVTTKDQNGTDIFGQTVSATISGAGLIAAACGTSGAAGTGTARAASVTCTASQNVISIAVNADGTSGSGTVTIVAGTTTLATKTVNFFDSPATIVAVQNHKVLSSAGAAAGNNVTNPSGANIANTPSVILTIKDKNGLLIPGLTTSTISAVSSDTTVMSESLSLSENDGTGAGNTVKATYNVQVTSMTKASGSKATLTFRVALGTSPQTYITSNALEYVLGGAPASVALSLDKAAYTQGQSGVATLTLKDSSGNAARDGDHADILAAALASSLPITVTLFGTAVSSLGGVATAKFNAPTVGGTWAVTGTTGTGPSTTAEKGKALSASATIADPNAGLLTQIDALNAKIVALNALIAKIMKKLGVR
jgi:hypothetical protein